MSLYESPKRDNFEHESPIRAFTNWTVQGNYALGKGFRPSLQHVVTYLDAMERREGWRIVQILEADEQVPSFLFRMERPVPDAVIVQRSNLDPEVVADILRDSPPPSPIMPEIVANVLSKHEPSCLLVLEGGRCNCSPAIVGYTQGFEPALGMPYTGDQEDYGDCDPYATLAKVLIDPEKEKLANKITGRYGFAPGRENAGGGIRDKDDPIDPKHYNGRECADIGERLSGNGYQVLKYCWRLGKKDDPCQELGKAVWYADSEMKFLIAMEGAGYNDIHQQPFTRDLGDDARQFLEDRIRDCTEFTQNIARMLWHGYNRRKLLCIIEAINEERFHRDCGTGAA